MTRTCVFRLGACVVVAMLVAGCSTPRNGPVVPVFYPPDPADARVQFLTSISRPEDVEPPPSALLTFAAGTPPPKQPIMKPYGLCLKNGVIYTCDTAAGFVHVIDLARRRWTYFTPVGQGRFGKPINIQVDDDGTRYVADTGRGQVLVYDAAGQFIATIGSAGELKPSDMALTGERIYIADLKSSAIIVCEKSTRKRLFSFPRNPAPADAAKEDETGGNERLAAPANIAIGPDGSVYVSDLGNFCIKRFDADGKLMRVYGRHGDGPGSFARNKGIAVDRDKRFYVADAAFENCQIFDDEGRLLLFFGKADDAPQAGLCLPAGVALDYEHTAYFRRYVAPGREVEYLILIANQYGDKKINVYGLLKKDAGSP